MHTSSLQPSRKARCNSGVSQLPLLALLWLSLLVVFGQAAVVAGELVYTGRHALKIPFDFQEAQIRALKATEVQLLVSTDHGRTWKTVSKATPQERQFKFNVPDNGEYWFAVRLVNVLKKSVQPGEPQVGLKVIVDDVAPSLDLKVRELSAGRVELTWQAEDDALDVNSLEIQYKEGESGEWQTVNVSAEASGRIDLKVTSSGTVFAEAKVADLARNTVTAESQAAVSPPASGNRQKRQPDYSKPVASNSPSLAPEEPRIHPFSQGRFTPRPALPTAEEPHSESAPAPLQSPALPEIAAASRPPVMTQLTRSGTAPASQSISYSGQNALEPALPNAHSHSTYPAGTKVVNSNSFQIGYQVEQIGPSGVGGVDLFITEDHGRTWYHYGSDPDRSSPFAVRVEKSGQFGFAIRARSGIGLSENPPKNGDLPEIVVVVDQVAPRPRLGSIQQGQGLNHNQIQFSWVLKETDLPQNPVMLLKSDSPNGPWEPITEWIENTGRYQWIVDQNIDHPVYIRLEARDLAGNVGRIDMEQPLQIDLIKPTARFTDIDTVTQ